MRASPRRVTRELPTTVDHVVIDTVMTYDAMAAHLTANAAFVKTLRAIWRTKDPVGYGMRIWLRNPGWLWVLLMLLEERSDEARRACKQHYARPSLAARELLRVYEELGGDARFGNARRKRPLAAPMQDALLAYLDERRRLIERYVPLVKSTGDALLLSHLPFEGQRLALMLGMARAISARTSDYAFGFEKEAS